MKKPQFNFASVKRQAEKILPFPALFYLVLVSQIVFSGCVSIQDKEDLNVPNPFDKPIENLVLDSDTSGIARLSVSQLQLNQATPFTLSFRNFQYGTFDILGDSVLVYDATSTEGWVSDSGIIQVVQSGRSKEGFVKIMNRGGNPISWTITWLKGTPVPDMNPLYLDPFDSRMVSNLVGMEEPGSIIDSIWGYLFSGQIRPDQKQIVYLAAGGIGQFLNFGTDHIYYRIKRPNGLFYRGMLPVIIGDSAQPMAYNDMIIMPSSGFMSWSTLLANDHGSNPVAPRTPVLMRLEALTYNGNKTILTQFGTIKDTVNVGVPAFYYKRIASGNEPDTTFIFLEEGSEKRITRSRLIVK